MGFFVGRRLGIHRPKRKETNGECVGVFNKVDSRLNGSRQKREIDAARDDEVEAQAEWGPKIAKEEEERCVA